MAISEKKRLNSDSVLVSLSDGTTTIEWDIAGDVAVIPTVSEPSEVEFKSQQINAKGEQKDGTWEPVELPVTWEETEEKKIREWELARTPLTYTVTGYYTDAFTLTDCRARLSDPAHIVPKEENYKTMTVSIKCMGNPYEEEA